MGTAMVLGRRRTDVRPAPPTPPYDGVDDRTLVVQVAHGDAVALEAIYRRYGRACYSLARRILVDDQLAEDAVQEVFLSVWRNAGAFDPARGAFPAWLMTLTHHRAVDAVRKEQKLRKRRTDLDALDEAASGEPQVEDQVWTTLRRERVRAALQALPEPQRRALALAYFGGYTQREIAVITGDPLGTVKTRMLSGMRRLRSSLEIGDADPAAGSSDVRSADRGAGR